MTWPTTKANTTHTDADTDLISLARPDINQNILNVNSIIDHLDIGTPANGDTLVYNSTSGVWQPGPSTGTTVMSFNGTMSIQNNATYNGGFTLAGSDRVTLVNSSTFTLPDGVYLIGVTQPMEVGSYGSTAALWTLTMSLIDAGNNMLATYSTQSTSFYFKDFDDTQLVTISGNNNCTWKYSYEATQQQPLTLQVIPFRIEKIS